MDLLDATLPMPIRKYIEIYLPPAASLAAGLNKDALRLTFYEVEGDSSSSGLGLINYRFDLPTLIWTRLTALPPERLLAVQRRRGPGWVDYSTTSPVVLAGAPPPGWP